MGKWSQCEDYSYGNYLSREAVHNWVEKGGKYFADDEGVQTDVQK
jgi:hypothetical protein